MKLRENLIGEISDTYKMIWGIRPRFYNFAEMSLVELWAVARELWEDLDLHMEEDEEYDLWWEEQEELREIQKPDFFSEIQDSLEKGLTIPNYRL